MKKRLWIIGFFIALVTDIVGIQTDNEIIQYLSKPMIIPFLAAYFFIETGNISSKLQKWILLALFFSWGGDVLLMFQGQRDIFFLLGLSSFLLAHIFYIIFFYKVRLAEKVKRSTWLLLVVIIYYAALITWLSPYLNEMKWPVRIYGVVISIMFMLAMHMLYINNKNAGKWMMTGALLFVISDSVLAVNKFYQAFEAAGIVIMLTYGIAQFLIVEGAIRYIRSSN